MEYPRWMIADFARRWHEIEPLLDQLFDVPEAQRRAWLHRHCRDATLRDLVEHALGNASGVAALERGVSQWLPTPAENRADATPVITGYRVLRFVSAGGMASVFEAERELPGGPQKVALKLLRIDVHSPDERGRFLREQCLLARLQHPHIAQLLDAGFSPSGTPFLALEFVDGDDIVTHCCRRHLGARARLALFIDVCTSVEHAHRSLIVHRDLKPSNVLVGADGGVKLVDFGIAKLLTGEGEPTRTQARRLTRRYAAPEQLAGDTATTAIDVYALGVLLAEMLCGLRPQHADEGSAPSAPAFGDAALRRRLGVDLHAIVRDATRFDPLRRYPSVAMLRDDIERHLAGKPLRARADTFVYRVVTLTKRHALAIAIGATIAAILAGAMVVSIHESYLARRAAADAHAQAVLALGEAQRADAVKAFLESLFDSASPGITTNEAATNKIATNETATELLLRGREHADRDFAMQPALRVEILALVGDLERRSGHPELAQRPLEQAAALAKSQFGATDRRTLHVEYLIAKQADQMGRAREAKSRLQRAIEAFAAGPNRESQEEVEALAWLAGLDERIGEPAAAIELGEKALALARRVLKPDSAALTEAVTNLGWIWMDAGHADRAEPLLREALVRKRSQFGARHAEVADAMTLLTSALIRRGRYDESEQLMRAALDIDAGAYARPHPHVAGHLNDLANVLALEGKLGEASTFYVRAIAVDRKLAPAAALDEAVSIGNLARIRFRQGAYAAAETGFREAIERKQRLLGADYADNGRSYDRASLAEILVARGRLDQAGTLADEALVEARVRYRGAHPDLAFALTVKARLMATRGDLDRAAEFAAEAVATYAALSSTDSDKSLRARLLLGEVLHGLDRNREAKRQLENTLAAAKTITPTAAVLMAHASADLARTEDALGDRVAARRLRERGEAMLTVLPSEPDTERALAMHLLATSPHVAGF